MALALDPRDPMAAGCVRQPAAMFTNGTPVLTVTVPTPSPCGYSAAATPLFTPVRCVSKTV